MFGGTNHKHPVATIIMLFAAGVLNALIGAYLFSNQPSQPLHWASSFATSLLFLTWGANESTKDSHHEFSNFMMVGMFVSLLLVVIISACELAHL